MKAATQKYKKHVNQGKMILPKEYTINTVKMIATESDIQIQFRSSILFFK